MVRNKQILNADFGFRNSKSVSSDAPFLKSPQYDAYACCRLGLRGLTLALLFSSVQSLTAQDQLLPVFHFEHLSTGDGLSTNEIRSPVVRDANGYIWIGTFNGLERYDGYVFKNYRNIPDDQYSLSSNTIWSLYVDSKQRLWVGTVETGLSVYDPNRDCFVNFLPRPRDSSWYQAKWIVSILEDRSGNIWLATESGGVVHFEIPADVGFLNADSLVRGIRMRTFPLGTLRNSAYDLLEREDGKILVASDGGLRIFDPATHEWSRVPLSDPLMSRLDSITVRCLLQDTRGNLWFGTATEGMFRIDRQSGEVLNYRHKQADSLSISSDQIWDIAQDQRGGMWFATLEGIDLFSPESGHCTPYLAVARNPYRFTDKFQLSVDRSGTLWISTFTDGLYSLSPKSLRIPHYSIQDPGGSPRTFDAIERDHAGKLWIPSRGIAFQIDVMTRRVNKTIDVCRGKKQTYEEPNNTASLIDRRGHFWYGTWGLEHKIQPTDSLTLYIVFTCS